MNKLGPAFGRLLVAVIALFIDTRFLAPALVKTPSGHTLPLVPPIVFEFLVVLSFIGLLAIALFSSISALRIIWKA